VDCKIDGEGPKVSASGGHLRPVKDEVEHDCATPIRNCLYVSFGFHLMMSTNSGVSGFKLLLNYTVIFPQLGAEGMIISGVLLDCDTVIAEVFLALVFAINGGGGSQVILMIAEDIVGGMIHEDGSADQFLVFTFFTASMRKSPSDS